MVKCIISNDDFNYVFINGFKYNNISTHYLMFLAFNPDNSRGYISFKLRKQWLLLAHNYHDCRTAIVCIIVLGRTSLESRARVLLVAHLVRALTSDLCREGLLMTPISNRVTTHSPTRNLTYRVALVTRLVTLASLLMKDFLLVK